MEKWKKIGKALLFPHIAIAWLLIPVAVTALVWCMVVLGETHPVSIVAYVLSAYTLTIWCCRIPRIITFFKTIKKENKYVQFWLQDTRLRVNVSLYGGFVWNGIYGVFQLCLGIYHRTFWYCSLALYYFLLGRMRYGLSKHARHFAPGEDTAGELKRYRSCGIILLFMNLALAVIIFFMVYWGRTFRHHPVTTIAMAAYTFFTFTKAIIDLVRYRKYESPVYSASKAISLAAACVSMLTLTATMLTTFGEAEDLFFHRLMLSLIGGAVSVFVITLAVYMIIRANQQLKSRK